MQLLLALLPLLLRLGVAAAQPANTTCFGATFRTVASQFEYRAALQASNCDLVNTRATRLFMLGACGRQHKNNFAGDGKPPPCPPGDWNVMSASQNTCMEVFEHAKRIDIRSPLGSEAFDEGHICNDGIEGVIFVQTDCPNLNASSVQLMQRGGGPDFCWDGHTFSRAAFIGIVVGGILGVLLLLSIPVALYLWRRRRRRQAMQVSPETGLEAGSPAGEKGEAAGAVKGAAAAAFVAPRAGEAVGTAHPSLEDIPEEVAYEVEYADSEAGTTPSSGIPVSSFASLQRT